MPGHVHPMTGPPKWCWVQVVAANAGADQAESSRPEEAAGKLPVVDPPRELRCWLVSKRFLRKRVGIEQRRAALLASGVSLDRNPGDSGGPAKRSKSRLFPCLRPSASAGDIFTPPRFDTGKPPYMTVPLSAVRGVHAGRTTTNLLRTKKYVLRRPSQPPLTHVFGRPLTLPFIGIAPRYRFFLLQVSIGGGDRRIGGGRAGCVPLLHNHILASNRCFLGHRQPSHSATVGGNLCGRRWDLFHDNPFRRQIASRGRGVAGNSRSAAFHGGRRRRYCLLSP